VEPGTFLDPNESLGAVLARLRKLKGLSGGEAGRRAGMSQAKVSRIETGRGQHSPADIGRLARALGADERVVSQLIGRAEIMHRRSTDWRQVPASLVGTQRVLAGEEADVETLFCFESTIIHGLLQTSEYARALLSVFQIQDQAFEEDDGNAAASVAGSVSVRIGRQELLADPRKSFRFVMMDAVLSNSFCTPVDMLAQIQRLREVQTRLANVSIAIVPADTRCTIPALHGFEILGENIVMVDTFNTMLTSDSKADVRLYQKIFESFAAEAVTDIEPILGRHEARYTALLNSSAVE
jgi:transcriptional regulator with XRE-family HTH domain